MKEALLPLLLCPLCHQALALGEVRARGLRPDEVIEGDLRCAGCDSRYVVEKGIPNLLNPRLLADYKKQEMEGWVNLWTKKGMYDGPRPDDALLLPYLDGVWVEVAQMFDMALAAMNLRGDEVVLEIGAGQGWASRYFAERGCRVVAIDIVADEWYGLGRAWAVMEKAGVYFEPMLADGERLPFVPDTFDVVFLCGALHHFRDIRTVLEQIKRVLKPGGRLVATGEPAASLVTSERAIQAQLEEVDEGIVERRPKVLEYWWRARQAGFSPVQIDSAQTYAAAGPATRAWIAAHGQAWASTSRPRYRPIAWLWTALLLGLPHKLSGRLALHTAGGNLMIRATKPGSGQASR